MAMPGVHHSDPAGEVDEAVPVGVGQDGAFGVNDRDRGDRRYAAGDSPRAAREERPALGAGDLGPELDQTGHGVS
jgi:hypothetical protein